MANDGYAKAIEIKNLVKKYKSVVAVNDISLDVYEGEIFGFLGPNGAGKTTTIKTLLGLIFPSSGDVRVLGKPAGDIDVKLKVSYLPESPYFYEHMSAREVVGFYGSLFGLTGAAKNKRVDYLLDLVGLQKDSSKPLRAFSKGMLQRVGIAQALINDPKLLFFDEPTSGLDPVAHRDIRDLIVRLKNEGRTIFLSSHQLSDVELVCDRVSILNRGKIRRLGSVGELIAGGNVEIIAENVVADDAQLAKLKALTSNVSDVNHKLIITTSASNVSKNNVLDWVRANKGDVISVTETRRSLEDIFYETVREGDASAIVGS
ncbi:ABC transporter ATP-binding protein [Capsulimonas corticalis]|uniref:ABC transporter ATP-binding protein n=1 Tax=Capsulimonas corticalis TaxID=2219043 RepID=A0A402D3X6_9BACT|nr:ABC transporter ATP-binding protein [Capsulimonas corticalis]BDI31824.1 ABC transporter ATP-binding protein [Capsulimonas corticalis]